MTQADVARALRAAQSAGPMWRVEIDGGVIRLVQGVSARAAPSNSTFAEDWNAALVKPIRTVIL